MWSWFKTVTSAYFIICLFYTVGLASDNTQQDDKFSKSQKLFKRSDFDSQTCSENFDVHNDKIIRTQDSINMGAKYLNEDELRSRKDCLRFCCETELCDVFVFEEKSPGSCYLFHCGPPDDFKCKFTKHKNYTSAVMSASRTRLLGGGGGPSELEEQIRLTKHEQQLVRLRKPEPETNTPPPPQAAPQPVTPPAPPPPPPAPTATPSAASATSAAPGRACSRFQFECRISGECIAIYNACDGIPQCADGSDEAPELDCPAPAGTTSPAFVPVTQGTPTISSPGKIADQHDLTYNYEQYHQQSPDLESNKMKVLQRPQLMESSQMQNIGLHFKPNNGLHSSQYEYLQPQQYQANQNNIPLRGEEKNYQKIDNPQQQSRGNSYYNKDVDGQSWPGYQHQYQQYDDQNNHIFNHKGKGLVTDTDRFNYNGFHPDRYNPTSQYEVPHDYKYNDGPGNYYNNQAFRQPIMQNWQGQQGHSSNHGQSNPQVEPSKVQHESAGSSQFYSSGPVPPDYYYEDSQEGGAGVRNQHLHQQGNRESITDSASPIQSKVPLTIVDHHHQHQDGVQKEAVQLQEQSATNKDEAKTIINASVTKSDSTTPKTVKQKNNDSKSSKDKHKTRFHSEDADLQFGLDESDVIIEPIEGQSDRPSGAILSLILGLSVTGIMVILVGCRLRLVRRRLRRSGKSPYTHDADYLVNGMYL